MISPKANCIHIPKKHNLYKRDFKNFDRESFLLDVAIVDWEEHGNENDPNKMFDSLHSKIHKLLDKHVPLRKLTKVISRENTNLGSLQVY